MENKTTATFLEVTPIYRGSLPQHVVDQALLNEGVPEAKLPRKPSMVDCLVRSVKAVSPRGTLVRQFPAAKDDVGCLGGVALATEDRERLDLTRFGANEAHQTSLTVKVYNGQNDEPYLRIEPVYHPLAALVASEFDKQRGLYLMNHDISVWMSTVVLPSCGAVRKRPNGGVYYVPTSLAGLLLDAKRAIESQSAFQKYGVNPVSGDTLQVVSQGGMLHIEPRAASDVETLNLVLDGVVNDVDSALTDVADKLQKGLGVRALRTQKGDVEDLERKLHTFESILGSQLPLLRQKIAETQAAIGFTMAHEEAKKAAKDNERLAGIEL